MKKNAELEIYFENQKYNWSFNVSKNQYDLIDLFLTSRELKELIRLSEFFDYSICVCSNKIIIH